MRIIKIKPVNFRGFGSSDWISLDKGLVLFHGPNGFGKTSLAEGLEWLLFGVTSRRQKGDDYSKTEYAGSYRNVHAPKGATTKVSAVVRMDDGTEHELARELVLGKSGADSDSITFVDGAKGDFASIGIITERLRSPVITQHGLQDFVHTTPKERRDFVSSALGLDSLIQFKNGLEKTRNHLRSSPPADVQDAHTRLQKAASVLKSNPNLTDLRDRWSKGQYDVDQDSTQLSEAAVKVLGLGAEHTRSWPSLLQTLVEARKDAAQTVYDTTAIEPNQQGEHHLQTVLQTRILALADLHELNTAAAHLLSATTAKFSEALLRLWQQGLALVQDSPSDNCPLCEASTFPGTKREEIHRRVVDNAEYLNAVRQVNAKAETLVTRIKQLGAAVTNSFPRFANVEAKTKLRELCHDQSVETESFLLIHDTVQTRVESVLARLNDLLKKVAALPAALTSPLGADQCSNEMPQISDALVELVDLVEGSHSTYATGWATFASILRGRFAAESKVAEFDSVITGIGVLKSLSIASVFQKYLNALLEDLRVVESHLQEKQRELIGTRGASIAQWYDLMNPGANVRYRGMEPGTNMIKLLGETFNKEISAPACLSQAQLNCLGLSVHFMRATAPGVLNRFLIIDDPVQSMDEEHTETFIGEVIPRLIDTEGFQVIVLSHLSPFVDRIAALSLHRDFLRYNYEEFQVSGPQVVRHEPIKRGLADIKRMAQSNEANRRLAVDRLRVVAEQLIRDIHLKVVGAPLDPRLDTATAAQLLPVFSSIPSTLPDEHQKLKDTIGFSDPSHHTEIGWQVPTTSQIMAHQQRLDHFAKKYDVL